MLLEFASASTSYDCASPMVQLVASDHLVELALLNVSKIAIIVHHLTVHAVEVDLFIDIANQALSIVVANGILVQLGLRLLLWLVTHEHGSVVVMLWLILQERVIRNVY